jgi:SAM-dependent methyltransferase
MKALVKCVKEVFASFRKRGVWATLQILVPEVLFDWRYGTDTFSLVDSQNLSGFPEDLKQFTAGYQGANSLLFKKTMALVAKKRGKSFQEDTFIDYGCGKGRALLMATDWGFKRIIGVELSDTLCEVAEENKRIFAKKRPHTTPIEVVQCDATQYEVPKDANVFFFFNPFRGQILQTVLEKVAAQAPKGSVFVYLNPTEPEAFEQRGLKKFGQVQLSRANVDALVYSL